MIALPADIPTFTPGVQFGLSRKQYEAIPAINQSKLKVWSQTGMLGSRKKFKFWLDQKEQGKFEDELSDALLFGSALDSLLLEPLLFDQKFAVWEGGVRRGKEWDAFKEESKGKMLLTASQRDEATLCSMSLLNRPEFSPVWKHCRKAVLQAELHGVPCKGEVDLYSKNSPYLYDLKTTTCAANGQRQFGKAVMDFDYHVQAAFYLDMDAALGGERKGFAFILVEKEEPYATNALVLDTGHPLLELGRIEYQSRLQSLAAAMEDGDWHDYPCWHPVEAPIWAIKELEAIQDGRA